MQLMYETFKWFFKKHFFRVCLMPHVTWGECLLFDLKLRIVRLKKDREAMHSYTVSPWRTHRSKGQIIEKLPKYGRSALRPHLPTRSQVRKGGKSNSLLFAFTFQWKWLRVSQWDPNQVYLKGKNGRELITLINRNAEDTVNINHT